MDTFLDTLMHLQPAMQLVAERLLHSMADAEDAVQEVVVGMWEKRDRLQHVADLEAYAMQSVKNRCVSLLRKHRDIAIDDIEALGSIDDTDIKEEVSLTEERAARLDSMMARLPERQRAAVQMKYIDQLSHEEMQHQLGMSSTNVYATLSRAMSALKAMIKQ